MLFSQRRHVGPMVVHVGHAMLFQDLPILRTQQARVANFDRVPKVLGELAEEGIQSRAELLARHSVPLELKQEWAGVRFKLRLSVRCQHQIIE